MLLRADPFGCAPRQCPVGHPAQHENVPDLALKKERFPAGNLRLKAGGFKPADLLLFPVNHAGGHARGIAPLARHLHVYLQRIKALSDSYAALQFVACNNTIAKLVREGKDVALVENAVVKPSAVQFVVERLQQGWSYVAI